MSEQSKIKNFFNNQTIFITGGTGFLGKVIIEKILRECENVKKIYLLVRPKKGKNADERFKTLFDFPCFDFVKSKNLNLAEKVFLIGGDCQKPFLGISEQDLKVLKEETNLLFHLASNLRFDQSLREATFNVRATRDLLEIAETMPNLKAFVFVSTAYSNCIHSHIEEKPYEAPLKLEDLLKIVDIFDDTILEKITPFLLGKWPNTYIFTKSISENLVANSTKKFPVTIVRPSIVTNAVKEPLAGWLDNILGAMGIISGTSLGIIRAYHAKRCSTANVVPVDYVCNCVLAATWKSARENNFASTVYNYIDFSQKPLTWGELNDIAFSYYWDLYPEKSIWYAALSVHENIFFHKVAVILKHTIPAYIIDTVLFCLRRPTMAVKAYRKLDKILSLVSYFSTHSWKFDCHNVRNLWSEMDEKDKQIFFFDMRSMNWEGYIYRCIVGLKVYVLKENLENHHKLKRKCKSALMFIAHYTVCAIFWYSVYRIISFILTIFW